MKKNRLGRITSLVCAVWLSATGAAQAAGDTPKRPASTAASLSAAAQDLTAGARIVRTGATAAKSTRTGTKSARTTAKRPAAKTAATRRASRAPVAARAPRGAQTAEVPKVSVGQAIGLHSTEDPLDLHSSVALVVDQRSGETLFAKNSQAVLPIASITKLMTALVVLEAGLPLDAVLEVSEADLDTEKGTRSRLRFGTRLTRGEMMQLALMASENRAAHALGRHYPGGMDAFVAAMNAKAESLGMHSTYFVDPTGLSSRNVSSARDLARLVDAAYRHPQAREFSTAQQLDVLTGKRRTTFRNTNRLIISPTWDIGLQKTGYISEAGNCLVMQVSIEGKPLLLVLLDATGRLSRFGDAQRLRNWIERDADARGGRVTAIQASFGS